MNLLNIQCIINSIHKVVIVLSLKTIYIFRFHNFFFFSFLDSPVRSLATLTDNVVCCVRFRDPKYQGGYKFLAKKLKNAKDPPRVLKPEDLTAHENRNWRTQIGMAPATHRYLLYI